MRPSLRRLALAPALVVALAACTPGATSQPSISGTSLPPASASPSADASPSAEPSPSAAGGTLTVYSGRSEELVAPILARFEETTGIDLEVRYASTSELAATILEEGDASPADVFFSQDGGALGALALEGRLAALPQDVLDIVDPRLRAADGTWVGVSGRARVLAYDSRELEPADLPASVLDLTDPSWKGRLGWVPTNASFQTFVTALRVQLGEDAAREWLEGVQANEPKVYEGNAAAVQAVNAGEIDIALVNHYYRYQAAAENGGDLPVLNHFFTGGDPGALINVAGVGILSTAANPEAADAFVRFLLAEEAQTYFAEETFEYPLLAGIPLAEGLPTLEEIDSPDLDLSQLADLEGTLTLLAEVGLL